jgi:hypothetical protein
MAQMTRKQALAVLAQLHEAYLEELVARYVESQDQQHYAQGTVQYNRADEALSVVAAALHGKPGVEAYAMLCRHCHLHYAVVGTFSAYGALLCHSCAKTEEFARTIAPVVAVERGMSPEEAYHTIIAC